MNYRQRRLASRNSNLADVILIDHKLSKGIDGLEVNENGTGIKESVITPAKKSRGGRPKGLPQIPPINKILEEIGVKTGVKLKCKKLTPIDTSMLLTKSD